MTTISECTETKCKHNNNGDCDRWLIRINKDGVCCGYEVKKTEENNGLQRENEN